MTGEPRAEEHDLLQKRKFAPELHSNGHLKLTNEEKSVFVIFRDDSRHRDSHEPLDRRREGPGDPSSVHDAGDAGGGGGLSHPGDARHGGAGDGRFGSSDTLRDMAAADAEAASASAASGRGGANAVGGNFRERDQYGRVKSPPTRGDPYLRDRGAGEGQYGDRGARRAAAQGDAPGETTYDEYGNPKISLSGRRGLNHRDGAGAEEGPPRGGAMDQFARGESSSGPGGPTPSAGGGSGGSQHLDPSSAATGGKSTRSRRKLDPMFRNDSLSSDPSDCVRPPPPKPHKHKKGKKVSRAEHVTRDA